MADDTLHFQSSTNFPVKLQCLVLALLFISYFAFILQTADFFFNKNVKWKQVIKIHSTIQLRYYNLLLLACCNWSKNSSNWSKNSCNWSKNTCIWSKNSCNYSKNSCNWSKNSWKQLTFFITVFFTFSFFVTIFLTFPFTFLVIWKFILVMKL